MSFCPTCGQRRTGDSRFCGGCGHEFREPAAAHEDTAVATDSAVPLEAVTPEAAMPADTAIPEDVTRWDVPADATRLEASAASPAPAPAPAPDEPDPFARWFAPDPPAPPPPAPLPPRAEPPGRWQAAATEPPGRWQTADTVYAAPGQAGYPPPAGPGPAFPPQGPGYPPPKRQSSGGAKAALIIVAVLVVLAAGGGAYALVNRSNNIRATAPSTSASAAPTTSASATGSASASPSSSTSASASGGSSGLVAVASSVGSNPATPQVETVLTHFFQGINTHSYTEYVSALDAEERAKQTQSTFDAGYSTTTDSGMTLTSLASTGNGGLAATVTFTSHQSASASVDKSTCNDWSLTFYLVSQGSGYLDGPAPADYQPTYSDC